MDDPNALIVPTHPVRFVTAASLFDGHDASINIMRRILQSQGARGHPPRARPQRRGGGRRPRSRRTSQGVAISSYQGGHVEYFTLPASSCSPRRGAGHVRRLRRRRRRHRARRRSRCCASAGSRIFSPEDGQRLGLAGMIEPHDRASATSTSSATPPDGRRGAGRRPARAGPRHHRARGSGTLPPTCAWRCGPRRPAATAPVLGITGTGGSGKSSLTDELVRRLPGRPGGQAAHRRDRRRPDPPPRRRRAARRPHPDERHRPRRRSSSARWRPAARAASCPTHLADVIAACKAAGYDLVIVETPGHRAGRRRRSCRSSTSSLYVMTPEFGAASQLEKIDMLDFADAVAINKFERRGAEDARRDVARQLVRNREAFGVAVGGHAGLRHQRGALRRRRRHRPVPVPPRDLLAEHGLTVRPGRLATGRARRCRRG